MNMGASFYGYSSKKSHNTCLKTKTGIEILIAGSDVLVGEFRPGIMKKWSRYNRTKEGKS